MIFFLMGALIGLCVTVTAWPWLNFLLRGQPLSPVALFCLVVEVLILGAAVLYSATDLKLLTIFTPFWAGLVIALLICAYPFLRIFLDQDKEP